MIIPIKKIDTHKVKIRYYLILLVETVLFLNSAILVKSMDLDRLPTVDIINISFDWAGMFSLIIILYSCIQGRKVSGRDAFMNLTFVIYLCLSLEVGAWAVDGIRTMRLWNYFFNIGCNSLLLVETLLFVEFVCKSLDIDKREIAFSYRTSFGMMLVGILTEILNIWFGYFYRINESGVYVRNTFGGLMGYIPFLYIICNTGVIIWKQQISFSKKLNYFSYAIIPLLISIWYTVTGYPPTLFMASFIAIMFIYGNIYINMGREIEIVTLENLRKDVELAWQRNQLTLSQIRPHFIFNCLGSIEELCRLDPERAKDALHRFSKYLRANMDSISDKYLVPFSNELEHIRNYVWLEEMRFEDDLEFQEDIECVDFSLPPLTIQPLVENAIKHGMMGMEEGTLTVVLSVKETNNTYEICIRDNGAGFDPKKKPDDGKSHIGIQNVRESLESKVNGTLIIQSEPGKGTEALVQIPKEVMDNEDISGR